MTDQPTADFSSRVQTAMTQRPGLALTGAVPALPTRASDTNKGDCGKIMVVGGSRGMAGAPCLASRAAFRSGAGLVLTVVPSSIWDVAAIKLDESQTRGVGPPDAETFDENAAGAWLSISKWADVVALGPGMTQSAGTAKSIREFVDACEKPMLLDADALNAFGGGRIELIFAAQKKNARREIVLTPHPGEMARLLNLSTRGVQDDRRQAVLACAELSASVVLLKGHETLVCDGQRLYVNRTGNPGMATGGSGDALTGIIAALMGQGQPAFEAACLGAHLHGLAGDIAASRLGCWSLIASDIIDELPAAFMKHALR